MNEKNCSSFIPFLKIDQEIYGEEIKSRYSILFLERYC